MEIKIPISMVLNMKIKFLILIFIIASFCGMKCFSKDRPENAETIPEVSNMKAFVPNSSWQRRICERCNGTGFTVESVEKSNNTVKKVLVVCPVCKGKGNLGMTKNL